MILGHLALVVATLFTGCALYINVVEQPSRLALPPAAALDQWKGGCRRVSVLLAGLSLAGFVLGGAAFWRTGNWQWMAGGVLLLAVWPYSFIGVMPTERRLRAVRESRAGRRSQRLIVNWGHLHLVRTGLGVVACGVLLCAALAGEMQ